MNERERWIVYPLLFLALGASLRDKIIKTTESQRIKCQGLVVVDSEDRPLLVLGAEQFPEMTPMRDVIRVDQIESQVLAASQVESNQYIVKRGNKGVLLLNAQNGQAVNNLLVWVSRFAQQVEAFQRGSAMRPGTPNAGANSGMPQAAPRALPPGATLPPLTEPGTP
jgi:hypothetical protein